MQGARRHLEVAKALLEGGFSENSAGAAYYAMLYAARAALSEEERNAKTHRGIWSLFSGTFVRDGRFPGELYKAAQTARGLREASDYRAGGASAEQAEQAVEAAGRFIDEVGSVLSQ